VSPVKLADGRGGSGVG